MTLYFFVYTFNSGKGNSQMANEFRIKNGAISPNIVITDTTASSSKTTGALQVAGGAGIVGNVYANAFYGNATGLTSIPGGNVSGTVPTSTTSGTVTTAAQPNITSVGTLTSITTSGIVTCSNTTVSTSKTTGATVISGGVGIGGNVYANAFYGNASGLTSIPGGNVSGEVGTANTVTNPSQPNITSVGTLTGLSTGNASGFVTIETSTPFIKLGRTSGVSSFPQIQFRSGTTTAPNYDSLIYASGGNGSDEGGNLNLSAASVNFSGKIGFPIGVGASVTQLTSRTTAVTINSLCGRVMLYSTTTTAGQLSTFRINNSFITYADAFIISQATGNGFYQFSTKNISSGYIDVSVYTPQAVTSAEAPAFNFIILRGQVA